LHELPPACTGECFAGIGTLPAESDCNDTGFPVMIRYERNVFMEQAISGKAFKGRGMEGYTARWYASITRKSMDDFKALARRVSGQLPPGSRVLEVAPGPGYFAIELAKLGNYRVTGLDISHTLVDIARQNASNAGVQVDFREGNAAGMPFEDGAFDFLLCRAAFKNFSQPVRALQEMCRVLREGGHALIIDLRRDASQESINHAVDEMGLGAANSIITKLTFRFMLLKRAYTKGELEQFLAQTKFGRIEIQEDSIGLELSAQK
jgi:ubiquinone/menaquinone biosynthesis C-methylase UbiE